MSNWRQLAEGQRWNEIRYDFLPINEQRELLEMLRAYVPMIEVLNGTEVRTRRMETHEAADAKLKAAAQILQLGELEAMVMGDPEEPSSEWTEFRQVIGRHLHDLLSQPEVTKGAKELSRQEHARHALENLEAVDRVISFMVAAAKDTDERRALIENLSELAQDAFAAGSHAQLAGGKAMEAHAVRGQRVKRGASQGGEMTQAAHKPLKTRRIAMMQEFIDSGLSQREATAKAEEAGLGDAETIRRQWNRDRTSRKKR